MVAWILNANYDIPWMFWLPSVTKKMSETKLQKMKICFVALMKIRKNYTSLKKSNEMHCKESPPARRRIQAKHADVARLVNLLAAIASTSTAT